MGQIINDAKAKYKTAKTLLQTLIDNSPLSDSVFDEIIEAYDTDEDAAMTEMLMCEDGEFKRVFPGGWNYTPHE